MRADLRVVAVNTPPPEPADQWDTHVGLVLLMQIVTAIIDRSNFS
jgi:hypothetical protein